MKIEMYTRRSQYLPFTIILVCLFVSIFPPPLSAQIDKDDHLSDLLNAIKTNRDTAAYNRAISWIQVSRDTVSLLYETTVQSELSRLEGILDDDEYYRLILSIYFPSAVIETVSAKYAAIQYAMEFAQNHNQPKSKSEEYALLAILRHARIPFRNSDRIYDGIRYYSELAAAAKRDQDSSRLTIVHYVLGGFYNRLDLYEKAKYHFLKSLEYLDNRQPMNDWNDWVGGILGLSAKVNRCMILGVLSIDDGDIEEGERYLKLGVKYLNMIDSTHLVGDEAYMFLNLAKAESLLRPDSSDFYFEIALKKTASKGTTMDSAFYYQERAANYLLRGKLDSALIAVDKSKSIKETYRLSTISPYGGLLPAYYHSLVMFNRNNFSVIPKLLEPEINVLKNNNARFELQKEMKLLADAYQQIGDYRKESDALRALQDLQHKIVSEADSARSINYEIEKEMEAASIQMAVLKNEAKNSKKTNYYLIGIAILLAISAATLILAFLNKRKSNDQLMSKNEELGRTLMQLQSTQNQLIHSEKMASLGELTAGIAHEIQNPLNFVNNFSDLNRELLDELKEAVAQNDQEEVADLIKDLSANETKINHHGKRAEEIVKSMLMHSSTGSGEKELTDINALADEYLRLSYHGLRAKDKSFNAEFKTELDPDLPKVKVIPQDIGRVVLNLINNAFQAVKGIEKPEVIVSTKKIPLAPFEKGGFSLSGGRSDASVGGGFSSIQITVSDNGSGIPDNIKKKIFQPFFTTKPTGQGTGLGLSMSYDIITKGHNGEITVETKKDSGTKFIISLPIN
ncbi:MAG: ATP-binding protein [Cyclobacteriaceae bacterium]